MGSQITPFQATILFGSAEARRAKAQKIAQTLLCSGANPPCGTCRDCRKVVQGIHPDLIPVERFMEEKDFGGMIKIDPIRALRADAFIRPNEAANKVYVIDNAQNMNPNSQNALLKLLEEGPAYAAFLLLCDRPGALLETIRSRCAVVSAGQEEADAAFDPRALEFAALCGDGGELERCAWLTRLELSKPDRPSLDAFLSDLARVLDGAALGSVTGRFDAPEQQRLAQALSCQRLMELGDFARRARDMTEFNVAPGHLLGWLGARIDSRVSV